MSEMMSVTRMSTRALSRAADREQTLRVQIYRYHSKIHWKPNFQIILDINAWKSSSILNKFNFEGAQANKEINILYPLFLLHSLPEGYVPKS